MLALAALAGGLLPAGNPVYAADPDFGTGDGDRTVLENTPPGVNIGDPISATDDDEDGEDAIEFGNTLTYSLEATADTDDARAEAASFDIDPSTGQLITKAPLDAETKPSYSVMVRVDDGESRENPITQPVSITITDVNEPPAAPVAPTVVSGPDTTDTDENESTTSLKVVWHAPENTGAGIEGFEVQYKKSTEARFSNWIHTSTSTTATINPSGGLEANTSYQVRVRATSPESQNSDNKEIAPWSLVGTGSTNKDGNSPPSFIEEGSVVMRDMYEDDEVGEDVGRRPVSAQDDGVLPLTYRLGGPDADLFDFDTSSGQIRVKRGVTYNHEDEGCGYDDSDDTTTCTHNVTVTVFDGAGGSDAKAVRIAILDVLEAPEAPVRPTVQATAKSSRSLDVSWSEPKNTGSPITSYQVRYRESGSSGSFSNIPG